MHEAVERAIQSIERYRKSPASGTISLEFIDQRHILYIPCQENFYDGGVVAYEKAVGELRRELMRRNIPQLLSEGGHVVVVDGLHGLAGLLQEVAADGLVGLLGVPGAAAGGPEDAHDGQHILVAVVFLLKIYHIFGLIARTLRFFAAFPAAFPFFHHSTRFSGKKQLGRLRFPPERSRVNAERLLR